MQKKYIGIIAFVVAVGILSFFVYDELYEITQKNEVKLSVTKTIESFNGNVTSIILTEGKYYSFVLDDKLDILIAHPREELVGTAPPGGLNNADISISQMLYNLKNYGSTWAHYEFYNPETGNVDPKSTYLVKEGEYVFGAGYYSP